MPLCERRIPMVCKNCGAAINEGQKFCLMCGADLSKQEAPRPEVTPQPEAAPAVDPQAAFAQAYGAPFTPPQGEDKPPKKKGKVKYFVLGAVAALVAVAVALTAMNWKFVSNQFTKMTMSEEEYLSHVYETGLKDMLGNAFGAVGSVSSLVDENDFSSDVSMKVEIGDSAWDLLRIFAGGQMEELEIPALVYNGTVSKKGDAVGGELSLGTDRAQVVSLKFAMEEDGSILFQIPQLSNTAVRVDSSLLGMQGSSAGEVPVMTEPLEAVLGETQTVQKAEMAQSGSASALAAGAGLMQAFPEEEVFVNLMTKYVGILLDEFEEVEAESTKLEVGELKEACTVYVTKFDADNAQKALMNILKTVKTDEDVKQILKDACKLQEGLDFDEIYQGFTQAVDEALAQMKDEQVFDSSVFPKIEFLTYVNGEGEIIGMEFEIEGLNFSLYTAEEGGKFATEISAKTMGLSLFEFKGEGVRKGDLVNAEYSLEFNETQIFRLEVADWNESTAAQGMLNGSITLKPGSALMEGLLREAPGELSSMLKTLGLKLEFSTPVATEMSMKASVLFGSEPLVSLSTAFKLDKAKEIPSFDSFIDAGDEAAMNAFGQEIASKGEAFMQSLLDAGIPEELFELVQSGGQKAEMDQEAYLPTVSPSLPQYEESTEGKDDAFANAPEFENANTAADSDGRNDSFDESVDGKDEMDSSASFGSSDSANGVVTLPSGSVDLNGDGMISEDEIQSVLGSVGTANGGSITVTVPGGSYEGGYVSVMPGASEVFNVAESMTSDVISVIDQQ